MFVLSFVVFEFVLALFVVFVFVLALTFIFVVVFKLVFYGCVVLSKSFDAVRFVVVFAELFAEEDTLFHDDVDALFHDDVDVFFADAVLFVLVNVVLGSKSFDAVARISDVGEVLAVLLEFALVLNDESVLTPLDAPGVIKTIAADENNNFTQ